MSKIVVFGAGYLGQKIAKHLGTVLDTSKIFTREDAYRLVQESGAEVIVNAIGFTGSPNVDQAEDHALRYKVTQANVIVPLWLAEACKALDKRLVHVSSGCIYNGLEEYNEEDAPDFEGSYYSFTKKAAERILDAYPNVLTLRIRMPLSDDHSPRNLITKLLTYEQIIETPNSITTVSFFLEALESLIAQDATGVFNVVCPQPVTHREILEAYDATLGKKATVTKLFIKPDELVTGTPRTNCVLSTDKLAGFMDVKTTDYWIEKELLAYKENAS